MVHKPLNILASTLVGFFLFSALSVYSAGLVLPNKPGTFAVAPARKELSLAAGQSQTFYLRVANNLGHQANFSADLNNLSAQTYGREGYIIATSTARYALSEVVFLSKKEFLLNNGEEAEIPITVSVPADWPPSSVAGLVNLGPVSVKTGLANAQIKTSAGILLLVRVSGPAIEKGQLEKFGLIGSQLVGVGQPIKLQVAYKNDGNVYLNPYGFVTVKNFFGQKIATQNLDPWFVLPQSIRLREVGLPARYWPGLYRSELNLNLGFNNQVIQESFYFLIIPNYWQWLIVIFAIIMLLRVGLRNRRHG
ncbi:MAG: hypothetical protein WCW56_00730 [Candidatus Paceibacterota bacterium]